MALDLQTQTTLTPQSAIKNTLSSGHLSDLLPVISSPSSFSDILKNTQVNQLENNTMLSSNFMNFHNIDTSSFKNTVKNQLNSSAERAREKTQSSNNSDIKSKISTSIASAKDTIITKKNTGSTVKHDTPDTDKKTETKAPEQSQETTSASSPSPQITGDIALNAQQNSNSLPLPVVASPNQTMTTPSSSPNGAVTGLEAQKNALSQIVDNQGFVQIRHETSTQTIASHSQNNNSLPLLQNSLDNSSSILKISQPKIDEQNQNNINRYDLSGQNQSNDSQQQSSFTNSDSAFSNPENNLEYLMNNAMSQVSLTSSEGRFNSLINPLESSLSMDNSLSSASKNTLLESTGSALPNSMMTSPLSLQSQSAPQKSSAMSETLSPNSPLETSPIDQINPHLTKTIQDGKDTIRVELSPESMGKVEIRLTLNNGQVQASVTADNPQTLSLLKNDSQSLHQSLQSAGFQTDANSLSFQLRNNQQDQQFSQNQGTEQNYTSPYSPLNKLDSEEEIMIASQAPRYVNSKNLDIKV